MFQILWSSLKTEDRYLWAARIVTSLISVLALNADKFNFRFHVALRQIVNFTFALCLITALSQTQIHESHIHIFRVLKMSMEFGLGIMNLGVTYILGTLLYNYNTYVNYVLLGGMLILFTTTVFEGYNYAYICFLLISIVTLNLLVQIRKKRSLHTQNQNSKFWVGLVILSRLEIVSIVLNALIVYRLSFKDMANDCKIGVYILYHFRICIVYMLTSSFNNSNGDLNTQGMQNLLGGQEINMQKLLSDDQKDSKNIV